jgi:hypothetical protein
MTRDAHRSMNTPSRVKHIRNVAVLVVFSGVAALVIAEILLRLIPVPGVSFQTYYYDELIGFGFMPGSTQTYRNDKGDFVQRKINSWGFLDVEHHPQKPPGTYRIGFFGDSYTEARQVPIGDTFFRLIEDELNMRIHEEPDAYRGARDIERIETLAFGISGRGPVHSYLEWSRWADRADLDLVVYVFCENDPKDQLPGIKESNVMPFVTAVGDSFAIDFSFRKANEYQTSFKHRLLQRAKSKSLVINTIVTRLRLLMRHGVKVTVTEEDLEGAHSSKSGVPGMAPSTWPSDSLITYAWDMVERVCDKWRREVNAKNSRFCIAYVPREDQLGTPPDQQDSWILRVKEYCSRADIPFLDPSPQFVVRERKGEQTFHDHFSAAGHRAFADAFVQFFQSNYVSTQARRRDSSGS